MTGRVHSFETMGTLDGPGMRCVVFLQGCPLRCLYCHNVDTWDPAGGEEMRTEAVVAAVERCRPYFGTHGGVTLSGGEPLLQADFAADILQHCRQRGIHTALDTSGCVMNPSVLACLDETNLVILDIKHTDPSRHKALAGFELSRSIGFMQRVVERKIPLWVRQVVIPGWNDSPADMKALAGLLSGVPTLRKVELLGFHRMAVEKYEKLGIVYPLADTPEPSEEHIRELQKTLDALLDFAK